MATIKRWAEYVTLPLVSPDEFRKLRKARGMSQRDLASAVGCTRAAISHLETGRMPGAAPDLATALAWRLDVPLASLFVVPEDARVAVSPRKQRRRGGGGNAGG